MHPIILGATQAGYRCLLPGMAVREGLVLVTLDKGILHLAGKMRDRVLLLTDRGTR
jgi:hypothetical protein